MYLQINLVWVLFALRTMLVCKMFLISFPLKHIVMKTLSLSGELTASMKAKWAESFFGRLHYVCSIFQLIFFKGTLLVKEKCCSIKFCLTDHLIQTLQQFRYLWNTAWPEVTFLTLELFQRTCFKMAQSGKLLNIWERLILFFEVI